MHLSRRMVRTALSAAGHVGLVGLVGLGCLVGVTGLGGIGLAGPAFAAVQVDPAFGYRIGDRVVAVGDVVVDASAKLDSASLPRTGRVNGWLSLEEVRVRPQPGGWQVVRTFQVTASAPEPRMLFLPKVELKFTRDGREIFEQLESVPISVSPLAAAEPILRTGFGAIRPDRDVPDPEAGNALRKAQLLAVVLVAVALLWFGLRAAAIRRRGYAPFALAAKRLRRAAAARDNPDAVRNAYRVLHDAFNQWAGQAVFASQTEKFLAEHPRFGAEAATVREFFDRSEKAFFGVPARTRDWSEERHGAARREPEERQSEERQSGRRSGASAPAGAGGRDTADAESEVGWLYRSARRLARIEQPGR